MIQHNQHFNSKFDGDFSTSAVLQAASQYILDSFNDMHDARLVYHNYQHTAEIVDIVEAIAAAEKINEETTELAQLAAWFSNIGYLVDYKSPQEHAIQRVGNFLEMTNYPAYLQDRVVQCLDMLKSGLKPVNLEQQLLQDAINAHEVTTNFSDAGPLLRLEWELMKQHKLSNLEWAQVRLQRLLSTGFHLAYAKKQFEPIVAKNLLEQKVLVEKSKKPRYVDTSTDGKIRKFQGIERKVPNSAIQTFFRTNYRNHINLSAIADNKANIMISVNAIMISVLISMISYSNITESRPMILMPVVIFLISGLTSLIFAVLSARPKVTSLNESDFDLEKAKRNVVFFGNFVSLNLDQYEEAMDALFRDGELIYGNMTRDLYHLGQVLDKKYRYLTISYNIFMVGFAVTVLTFLAALFAQ